MNIEDLMTAAMSQPQEPKAELTDAQVVVRLREAFALLQEKNDFTPGQVIVHKFPSMADTRNGEQPRVFMDMLAAPIPAHEAAGSASDLYCNSATALLDCRVGILTDNGQFSVYYEQSKYYRPHPDFQSDGH